MSVDAHAWNCDPNKVFCPSKASWFLLSSGQCVAKRVTIKITSPVKKYLFRGFSVAHNKFGLLRLDKPLSHP